LFRKFAAANDSYVVFGKHKVPFKQVFDEAQEQLRNKFGMEMIELPSKEKTTKKARIGNAPNPHL
jgi:hypothetical protein